MTEEIAIVYERLSHFFEERKFADLRMELLDMEPADIALFIDDNLDDKEQIVFFRLLPKELASDVFVEIDTDTQEELIRHFTDKELKAVIDDMFLDDTVDVIEEMPANVVKRILKNSDPENRKQIENNAKLLNVPIQIFESNIFDSVLNIDKSPCYICARMRRGHLYAKAKELGCNKIALGHHYDDVIETILMGMLYGAQVQTMMPKLHSSNFEGMELIRPMYLIREKDIKHWRDYNELKFLQCACKFTADIADEVAESKRQEVKRLIAELEKQDSQIPGNIFKSVENVNLSTIIAYKDKNGDRHHFKDEY
jgi:hypothetical protein